MKRKVGEGEAENSTSLLHILEKDDLHSFKEFVQCHKLLLREYFSNSFPEHLEALYHTDRIFKYAHSQALEFPTHCSSKNLMAINCAARNGDEGNLLILISIPGRKSINYKDISGETPLFTAVSRGHLGASRILIEAGATLGAHSRTKEGVTLLEAAITHGYYNIVQLLLDSRVYVNGLTHEGLIPLALAAREGQVEISRLLIDKGAKINSSTEYEKMPLSIAAKKGYAEIVSLLLSRFNLDMHKTLPLYNAVKDGQIEVIKVFLTRYPGEDKLKLLQWALENSQQSIINFLLEEKSKLLYNAVKARCENIINFLLENEADENFSNETGLTLLHIAEHDNEIGIMQSLIKRGAQLNIHDCKGFTPLHAAVHREHAYTVDLLLAHGANPNVHCIGGITPLHTAVIKSNIEIILLLLQYKADMTAKAYHDSAIPNATPLDLARSAGNSVIVEIFEKTFAENNTPVSLDDVIAYDNLDTLPSLGFTAPIQFDGEEANFLNHFSFDS